MDDETRQIWEDLYNGPVFQKLKDLVIGLIIVGVCMVIYKYTQVKYNAERAIEAEQHKKTEIKWEYGRF